MDGAESIDDRAGRNRWPSFSATVFRSIPPGVEFRAACNPIATPFLPYR